MNLRITGALLVVAEALFWISWVLMPGVGVTDTMVIFALAGQSRANVFASVVLQLVSAAAFAPALVGIEAASTSRLSRAGTVLLLVGAMGSAAGAIFHLVAYEMTAPGIDLASVAPIMRRLQGPGLGLLLPFVLAFFTGHAFLASALRKRGPSARVGAWTLALSPLVIVVGAPSVHAGLIAGRIVGLAFLAAVSSSLALTGAGWFAAPPRSLSNR